MRLVLLTIFTGLIVGCNVVYEIDVKKDGSAHIEQRNVWVYENDILAIDSSLTAEAAHVGGQPEGDMLTTEESIQPYLKSTMIKNFVWTTSREAFFTSSYDISNIDSLGNYIDAVHRIVQPEFRFNKNSLTIDCPVGDPAVLPDTIMSAVMFVEINLKLPFKISNIETNNQEILCSHSGKHARIKFRMRCLFYRESSTKITINA